MTSRACLLAIVSAAVAVAQPLGPYEGAERALVRKLLQSADYKDLAWGAHLAGKYEDRTTRDDLIRVMDIHDPDVQLQALDSLIRLGFSIEREHLERWYIDYPVQTLILSTRMVEDQRERADFYASILGDRQTDALYIATLNLLAQIDRVRAATSVLPLLEPEIKVLVLDPNQGLGVGGAGVGGSRGCGAVGVSDRPPRTYYSLQFGGLYGRWDVVGPGLTTLANGAAQVYYVRSRTPDGRQTVLAKAKYRFAMVEWLLNRYQDAEAKMPLKEVSYAETTVDKLQATIAEARLKLGRDYADLVVALMSRGLLPEGFRPPILKATLTVDDRRAGVDRTQPPQTEEFTLAVAP